MELTLGQAAKVTGLGKTTLTRAIKRGHLSATRRENGSYAIDPSELSRVYKMTPETLETVTATGYAAHRATPDGEAHATPRDVHMLLAVAQAELRHLGERLEEVKASQEDLRRERDDWKEQAQRLALAAPIAAPGPIATPATPVSAPEPRRSLLRYWFGLRAAS
jgi:excisionase family DNA binding protein